VAQEIRITAVTVPAGTAKTSLQRTVIELGQRNVDEIEVVIPDGPRGEVGFWIGSGGTQIIPHDLGQFIISNNEVIHWPLESQHTSGSWELQAYNTGNFPHTLELRFLCSYVGSAPAAVQPLTPDQLAAAGEVGTAPPDLPQLPELPAPTLPPIPSLPPIALPGLPGQAPAQQAASSSPEEEDMTGPVAFVHPFNGQSHKFQARQLATGVEHWWQSDQGGDWQGPEVLPGSAGKVAPGAPIYASVYSVQGQLQVWAPLADNSGAYHAWQGAGAGTWGNETV